MKQNIYKRLEELERVRAADLQASADRAAAQLVVEGFQAMMRQYAIEPLPSESRADAFARVLGISSRELADLPRKRSNEADSGLSETGAAARSSRCGGRRAAGFSR
jgi:hypothetical protein